ncbi:MAG: glycine cleavage system protein GcvH [Verrucomicrobia bacterium]|nr:glycine cleavage system protein GcvH [Verrucomicrobiota bacterium]
MLVPDDLRYSDTHEWIKVEGDIGTVGISDHAQSELGDIVFIELPSSSVITERQARVATVESVKAASDIYSPASGEVFETNAELETNPGLVNFDPYGAGWLFKLKLTKPEELQQLRDSKGYEALIAK